MTTILRNECACAICLTLDEHVELEELAAEYGCGVFDLVEGVMQFLGRDPELLRLAAGVSEPQLEPEVIGGLWRGR